MTFISELSFQDHALLSGFNAPDNGERGVLKSAVWGHRVYKHMGTHFFCFLVSVSCARIINQQHLDSHKSLTPQLTKSCRFSVGLLGFYSTHCYGT